MTPARITLGGLAATVSLLALGSTALGTVGEAVPASPWSGAASEPVAVHTAAPFIGAPVTTVEATISGPALRPVKTAKVDRAWVKLVYKNGRTQSECLRVSSAPESCHEPRD